ncbi:hypothetical protein AGABI1DRAFT_135012 [Agaricus bisporus var. burnettii JB137-S8]|uniref:Secreted protein n=1 Tax=Agaricus bisporus var. burnettii (strain JB137-S8 / ATCC MYA-4627 / FGSC 10392) TaxID=597362 RepID=K5VG71_AGABU|nr:uncharacterized protein AGABI1DRAFT_135012 [Agaricus bisporus var. burnettii JB137-S8]EKM73339.1 hypothetical protein AGABI1DRAFT_135012 [Agaricus bisporus var. burnettii JB137-S8]
MSHQLAELLAPLMVLKNLVLRLLCHDKVGNPSLPDFSSLSGIVQSAQFGSPGSSLGHVVHATSARSGL